MTDHPISTTYLDQQQARVSAALPAAGAWDAAPTEMPCAGFKDVMLYFSYTRGAAGGDFQFRVDVSPDSAGAVWHQGTIYDAGAVASGADTLSNVQREEIEYGSTGAAIERFAYGPISVEATVERIRVPAQESGVVLTPGTLEIEARFS